MPLAHGMGHASTAGLNGTLRDPRGEHKGAGAALRMIDFVTGVFLTVRKTALCQERTSSIIAPLRLELPALQALLPALDVPVQRALSDAPITTTQRQGLERLGKGGQAQGPLRTPRARAARITLHA